MPYRINLLLLSVNLLIQFASYSQVKITGEVLSAKDSTAVFGASVYLNGTSIGTSTGDAGKFDLNLSSKIKADLVISSIGFNPINISNITEYSGRRLKIFLKEKEESLETVYLEADPWTREKKLRFFREQFLGQNLEDKDCIILNEKDLYLRFIPSKKTLIASSDNPLVIKNFDLGYQIDYNLVDFHVKFQINEPENPQPISAYFAGTSYFQNIAENIPKRILRKRRKAYLGSAQHFLRALKQKDLKSQDFELYEGRFQKQREEVFRLSSDSEFMKVKPLMKTIRVLYDKNHFSKIHFDKDFYIDDFGNFSPPDALVFSGYIGASRISKMVPLDFKIKE